ncbi:PREDICTED: E3 ubiquitin-protein ligase MIB1-like [Wasmannia auropunctata]|uniref:E3 ubiquitin-protein ligase MIB1-like n=1 Tax=Wasmannia auropunctata TaxID=64793 RepID=UPI0005EFC986|nr:PREDICTED: E3 ubiquitin-protein ligase MIB1-like [Wasmannia auropunctata]
MNLMEMKNKVSFNSTPVIPALNGHREIAAILLSQNGGRALVDLRNNQGQTPLHLATSQGYWPLVELLLHHNADVSSIDKDGNTVLHIACCTANSPNQQIVVPTPENSRDSPLIYAIWQNLARQGAQTELALACFLISADRSCKLLMQVKNNKNKTPFDLLEGNQQVAVLAYFLGFCKCQSYSTQLEIKKNSSTADYVEHRIDNMLQTDRLRSANKNIAGFGDALSQDCSAIIANTKEENRNDPSSNITVVGCNHSVNTQTIQDGQLATDEVFNPDKSKDVSSESKRKEEISDREKDNNQEPLMLQIRLQMLNYLMTTIADFREANMCNICVERRRNVAFLCGHCACEHCAEQLNTCHICCKTITKKINLYIRLSANQQSHQNVDYYAVSMCTASLLRTRDIYS